MNKETKAELLKIVEQISEFEKRRVEMDARRRQLMDRQAQIANQAILKVMFETNESGKPRYSNDKARNAAADLLLQNDAHYQELENEIQDLYTKDKMLAVECVRLKAHYQVILAHFMPAKVGSISFPSLEYEDLDLLAASADLPLKVQRLMRPLSVEPPSVMAPSSEQAKKELPRIEDQIQVAKKQAETRAEPRTVAERIKIVQDKEKKDATSEKTRAAPSGAARESRN